MKSALAQFLLFSSALAFQAPRVPSAKLSVLQATEADASSTITLAFTGEKDKELRECVSTHPLMGMMDASTEFVDIACTSEEADVSLFDETVDSLDIACFGSPEAVKSWLNTLDHAAGVQDQTEEERRAAGNGGVVAACIGSETARVVLETGRWDALNIYYPKGDDNMQGWAQSAAQAAADLIEKRFWE